VLLTLWSVRIACLLYALALAAWLTGRRRAAPLFWTAALIFYLAHVIAAFVSQYHWSNQLAYAETARQTAEVFKLDWGGGLYFNYAFTAIWATDVIWLWWKPASYDRRSKWINSAIHGFMAFMFFNGAIIFASGWVRWFALSATAILLFLRQRNRSTPGRPSFSVVCPGRKTR